MGLDLGLRDLVDVLVVAVLAWLAIRYLRRTRARAGLLGLAVLGLIYGAAQWFDLTLTAAIFQGFFAVVVLVLVVVFQSDLRRVFEQVGASVRTLRRLESGAADEVDLMARTLSRLAAGRVGALIVIPGREPLEPHLEGGITLGGQVSEPLLLSLFDASSPGHDGAVVVAGGQVERFAAHLPLSADHRQLGQGGTRHAAALGLTERCDALCIVVSEERGTVGVARDGVLRELARPEDVAAELRAFREPREQAVSAWRQPSSWLEALAAVGTATVLWVLVVLGATQGVVTVPARVLVENLPEAYELENVEPERVDVTLSGRRRDLLLARSDLLVRVDVLLVELGRRTFELDRSKVACPASVEVEAIEPARVKISVRPSDTSAGT